MTDRYHDVGVSLRLSSSLLAKLDEYRDRVERDAKMRVSRSQAVRMLMVRGLERG